METALPAIGRYEDLAKKYADAWVFSKAKYMIDGQPLSFDAHGYLLPFYQLFALWIAVMKPVQMGFTEWLIVEDFMAAAEHGMTVLHVLPGGLMTAAFVPERVDARISESPYLLRLLDPRAAEPDGVHTKRVGGKTADSKSSKKIGPGWVHFRGATDRNLISTAVDRIVLDERNEISKEHVAMAEERLAHSKWGMQRRVSVPGFTREGIHADYLSGTCHRWMIRCDDPGHGPGDRWQVPDWTANVRLDTGAFVCAKCGARMNRLKPGEYVPEFPSRAPRYSYSVSGLIRPKPLRERIEFYKKAEETGDQVLLKRHWNAWMGVPWVPKGTRREEADVTAACAASTHRLSPAGSRETCVMGVDLGRETHYFTIWRRERERLFLLWGGTFYTFDTLDGLMAAFRVQMCVVDGSPETGEAKRFALRHPGRVILAEYNTSGKVTELVTTKRKKVFPNDARTYTLATIARTEAMDLVYGGLGRDLTLALDSCAIEDFAPQVVAPRRVVEEGAPGQFVGRWVNEDPDHYFHAILYAMIAARLAGPIHRQLPDASLV
jgi:hypothetical protein